LSPERYLLKVTLGEEAKGKLEHARDLLRHKVPDGDLATVIELALEAVIEKTRKRKFAKTSSPRKAAGREPRESEARPCESEWQRRVKRAGAARRAGRRWPSGVGPPGSIRTTCRRR
jgi:hypothetical protein